MLHHRAECLIIIRTGQSICVNQFGSEMK